MSSNPALTHYDPATLAALWNGPLPQWQLYPFGEALDWAAAVAWKVDIGLAERVKRKEAELFPIGPLTQERLDLLQTARLALEAYMRKRWSDREFSLHWEDCLHTVACDVGIDVGQEDLPMNLLIHREEYLLIKHMNAHMLMERWVSMSEDDRRAEMEDIESVVREADTFWGRATE